MKILDARHSFAWGQLITPAVQSLRSVSRLDRPASLRSDVCFRGRFGAANRNLQRSTIQRNFKSVVHRRLRRQRQLDHNVLLFLRRILDRVRSVKGDFVSAEPQQPLLAVSMWKSVAILLESNGMS